MSTYSIIQKSQLEGAHRLDAEYYQPEYLDLISRIRSQKSSLWRDIKGKFITGPFGSEFNVENYVAEGKFRYIRGRDVKEFFVLDDDNVYIPEKDYKRLSKYSLQEGDILISVVGTLGNASIIDNSTLPAIFSCKSTAFRTTEINPYFFIAYLNSNYGKKLLERNVRGAVQTGLNIDDLKDLAVIVPHTDIQREVGNIVLNAKKILENSKMLYSQAEYLLLDELGLKDFEVEDVLSYIVNLSEIKSSHRADAEYFQPKYEKLISKIRNQNEEKLSKLAKRIKIKIRPKPEETYKYIEIGDISVGSGDINFNEVIGKELPANARIPIKGGELIISKVRPTRGAISIVPSEFNNRFICSGAFSVFQAQEILKEYLFVALRSIIGKLQFEKPTTGTSYPTITDEDVEHTLIPILPKPAQKKIADLVQKSHEARSKAKQLLAEAKNKVEELIA